jgi:hypothetical protein
MNDNDLERLVNLLSYLKKHDDVESELGKAPPREYTSAVTDPVQRKLHEAASPSPDRPFSPGVIDAAHARMSSRYSGDPSDTSSDTSSDIPEISDTSDPDTSDIDTSTEDPAQKEIWQRLGQVAAEYGMENETQLIEMIEQYTAPVGDDPQGIVKPYKDYHPTGGETGKRGGKYDTLGDKPIESVTAPAPLHTVIRSDPNEHITKSSESILLSLLDRLGI